MPIQTDPASQGLNFAPVTAAEVDAVMEMVLLRPAADWMRKIPASGLRAFLSHAARSPHAVLLGARLAACAPPIGYQLAIVDSRRFRAGFALRHPAAALAIALHRRASQRERLNVRQSRGLGDPRLPEFSWSPARLRYARIVASFVREEHREKGLLLYLYFSLFDMLKEKGCARVEEYVTPDEADWARKFPQVGGWTLQACSAGGYKITRAL